MYSTSVFIKQMVAPELARDFLFKAWLSWNQTGAQRGTTGLWFFAITIAFCF